MDELCTDSILKVFRAIAKCPSSPPSPAVQQKKEQKKKKDRKAAKKAKTDEVKKGAVNEEKVDLLLEMLKQADATDVNQAESETLLDLEGSLIWNTTLPCL